ncbi:hypothetical protein E2N92_07090 [Methanofollis formosanus]|uniref:Uncharacterized protein n=1 Tax=Methanofollis formosanus TaxID=299308 RepID=A0A8G1EGJ4_9EURY|nr:hypothetical protein [Methanofollis formosanus]QYZ79216.1 hypothetical protein E2N92_07090 [Methanofollis formosanus]
MTMMALCRSRTGVVDDVDGHEEDEGGKPRPGDPPGRDRSVPLVGRFLLLEDDPEGVRKRMNIPTVRVIQSRIPACGPLCHCPSDVMDL